MKKLKLSPTKISTYLACPVKYRWTYIDPRGKWYLRSKSYYSFGTSLHKVLEMFHDGEQTGVKTTAQTLAALEENWIDAGYESAEDMLNALGEGKQIIETYIESFLAEAPNAQTIYIEKLFKADLGDFILQGRMDRVDQIAENSYNIVDYKSYRENVTEQEVHNDLAMGCYQLLLQLTHPEATITTTIIALKTNQKATTSLTAQELELFKKDLIQIAQEILEQNFMELAPVFKEHLCPQCDFLRLCKKDHFFAESLPSEMIQSTE